MDRIKELKAFHEEYEDTFYDYLSDVKHSLKFGNSDYENLYKQIYKILDKYPNLPKIVDEVKLENGLSTAECMALSNLLGLYFKSRDIEDKEIFYTGSMNAYHYFRDMGIME